MFTSVVDHRSRTFGVCCKGDKKDQKYRIVVGRGVHISVLDAPLVFFSNSEQEKKCGRGSS